MVDPRNLVVLTGGLTRDPEARDGQPIRFGLGVDNAGYDKEKPDQKSGYFDVVVFSNRGDKFIEWVKGLKKGDRVSVVGSLQWSRWSQDGNSRTAVSVIAESIRYAGSGGTKREGSPSESPASNGTTEPVAASAGGSGDVGADFVF